MSLWQRIGTAVFWLVWPLSTVLVRRTQRTRLLIQVGDEILVTRSWLGDGRWSLTGGGLHRGEDPTLGVLRETEEEIGLTLQPGDVRLFKTEQFQGSGQSFLCHYFVARLNTKPPLQLQRFEITASKWVRPADITSREYREDVLAALR